MRCTLLIFLLWIRVDETPYHKTEISDSVKLACPYAVSCSAMVLLLSGPDRYDTQYALIHQFVIVCGSPSMCLLATVILTSRQ